MYALGKKSLAELEGVSPRLVQLPKRAIQITTVDFSVHDGLRTKAEQAEYVRTGASTTMESKHLPQPSGFGEAVDLVPFVNGKLRWEWPLIFPIASAMRTAAIELNVGLTWGAVWDMDMRNMSEDLEEEIEKYKARRRKVNPKARIFLDGPHYQLR